MRLTSKLSNTLISTPDQEYDIPDAALKGLGENTTHTRKKGS